MDNSNKAIAKRINKELRNRHWSQSDLLREVIKFKNPNFSKTDIYTEVKAIKANFSTALKGTANRSISKEDLYIISKVFGVPLEYIWFGETKKSGFIPSGARFAAYQDNETEYRKYIANLEYEDRVQYGDEFGFSLFDYFGQFDSINGYKFFAENYNLHFDYMNYGILVYVNSEGREQNCSTSYHDNHISSNLIETLAEHKEIKLFRTIYFDNCSYDRFNYERMNNNKNHFDEDFLDVLLQNEDFLDQTLKIKTVDLNDLRKVSQKGEKRAFVEPMFFEALSYALANEDKYKPQLQKMLTFALEYNKNQLNFIKQYLKENASREYGDVSVDRYCPHLLKSSRNVVMGNIIELEPNSGTNEISNIIKEIEECAFNMTHILNEQEKNNEEIKITTPNNPLFSELLENAIKERVDFVPTRIKIESKFTRFHYYESKPIDFNNLIELRAVVNFLDKSQMLVDLHDDETLVHGNLDGQVLMIANGEPVGLAGWQKCHYGDKFEDRAKLLSCIDIYYFDERYIEKYRERFEIISEGLNKKEKEILINKALKMLEDEKNKLLKTGTENVSRAMRIKERSSKLEFFRDVYLTK